MKSIKTKITNEFSKKGNNSILYKGASGGFVIKISGAAVGFALHIVLTRNMGAGIYGEYMYVLSWVNFISVLGISGFSTTSTRYVAEYKTAEAWSLLHGFIRVSRIVVLFLSLSSSLIIVLLSYLFIDSETNSSLLYTFFFAAFVLPVLNLLQVHSAELKGVKEVIRSLLSPVLLRNLLILGCAGIYIIIFTQAKLTAPCIMALNMAATAVCYLYSKKTFDKNIKEQYANHSPVYKTRRWLLTAKDMLFTSGFNVLLLQADQIILGILNGPYEVGIYAVIVKIASLVVFALVAVNSVLSPIITELYTLQRRKELQQIVTKGVNITFVISLLIIISIIFLDDLLLSVFGEEFVAGEKALWVLLVSQLINAVAGPAVLLLNMTGFQNYSAKILGVSALINIGLNFLLIPSFGVVGAAFATLITTFIWNTLSAFYVWKKIEIVSVTNLFFRKIK